MGGSPQDVHGLVYRLNLGGRRLLLLPILGMCILPAFSAPTGSPRHSLDTVMWCWSQLQGTLDWIQLNPLDKLLRLDGQCGDGFNLQPPKTSLCLSSLAHFLNQPPPNLGWPASFFGPSLPSTYRGRLRITPGKIPRSLQTNRWAEMKIPFSCSPYFPYIYI